MSAKTTVKNWCYPFKAAGGAEVTDPQVYFDALARAANGFYPMGSNGLWHGGVHFDEHTATLLDQSAVRCIADGEVVAYRIDASYPTSDYKGLSAAPYSTGFVLVRHRLELPPAPASANSAAGSAPAETGTRGAGGAETDGLTFFSLYMHLLDWAGYEADPALPRPAFWGGEGLYTVKSDASDRVVGLNVRAHHKVASTDARYADYQNRLATLPRGTRIETAEAAPSPYHGWRRLVSATPAVEGLAENSGWIYVPEAEPLAENQYLIGHAAKDVPALEQFGLNVREAPNGHSRILAVLPRGTRIKLSEGKGQGGYAKLEAISGDAAPLLAAGPDGKVPGFVWLKSLETDLTPNESAEGAVYILPEPRKIDAGELIGHMGLYQDYDQARPGPRLHLEVFSCEDVPAFIAKSRARAAALPESQKTLIKVHKGSSILQPICVDSQVQPGCDVRLCEDSPTEGRWAKVQKYTSCNAQKDTELGSFDSVSLSYALSRAQKDVLAARMGIAATDMPEKVDFLKVAYDSIEGGAPCSYASGSTVPSTHRWRKVGVRIGQPLWVERSKLSAEGQRSSTADGLAAWTKFPLQSTNDGTRSGYDRILPAASWAGLPHERKAIDQNKVRWWHITVGDDNGGEASGWVPEKDLIVTRHSPWEWPGFSTIEDASTLDAQLARTLKATGDITNEERQNYSALIEATERGPILSKLYEVIDQPDEASRRDGELTPGELKAAMAKPWLAQQLSLLVAKYESEWLWNKSKWDELDPLFEKDQNTANLIWEAEKQRIEGFRWWKNVLPDNGGMVWHLSPPAMILNFGENTRNICNRCKKVISVSPEFMEAICPPAVAKDFVEKFTLHLNDLLERYEVDSCSQITHLLSQAKHETKRFTSFRESLYYSSYTAQALYNMATTAINNGFRRKGMVFQNHEAKLQYIERHLLRNDAGYGNHCFGSSEYPENDYRGRGLLHLTHYVNYRDCALAIGKPVDAEPALVERDLSVIVESGLWFWKNNMLKVFAEDPDLIEEDAVEKITRVINGGVNGLAERTKYKREITSIFVGLYGECAE